MSELKFVKFFLKRKLDGGFFAKYIKFTDEGENMRTRGFRQNLEAMPDGMAKRIYLKILNTPKPDYEKMEREAKKYVEKIFSQMTEEERKLYENAK